MFKEIKKLFSHSVVYGLGNYSTKVLGFFLIPVYTRYLVPADYGILALATLLGSVLFIILNEGQSSAFFRSYYDYDDPAGRKSVISTSILLTMAYCLPFAGIIILLAQPLSRLVFGAPIYGSFVVLVCVATVSRVFLRIPFAILRAEERSKQYAVLSVLRGLLGIVLALILVVGVRQGVSGILWSQFASQFVFCLLLLPGVVWGLRWTFSKQTARDLLSFGVQLMPAGIATFILNLSDRYFLRHYSTLDEVGLYSLGYSFGEVLWLLVTALQLAYVPFVLSNMKSPHARSLYARVATYYLVFISFLALGLSLLSPEIIKIMATPAYHEAYRVVPLVAVAQIFRGFSFIGPVGLTIERKPIYRTYGVFIAAALNLMLNYLWIPTYGMMGAAAATTVAFMAESLVIIWISQRFYTVPYEYGRLIKMGTAWGAIYFVSTWLPPEGALLFNLSAKAALLTLFPFCLLALRFLQVDERGPALEMIRVIRGRLGLVGQGRGIS